MPPPSWHRGSQGIGYRLPASSPAPRTGRVPTPGPPTQHLLNRPWRRGPRSSSPGRSALTAASSAGTVPPACGLRAVTAHLGPRAHSLRSALCLLLDGLSRVGRLDSCRTKTLYLNGTTTQSKGRSSAGVAPEKPPGAFTPLAAGLQPSLSRPHLGGGAGPQVSHVVGFCGRLRRESGLPGRYVDTVALRQRCHHGEHL